MLIFDLNKIAIVENGDTFYTLQKQIIECERIVEKEKINIYKNKSLVNPNYPIYEVLGGEWTFKEYICPLTERNSRVSEIQRKLIEQGYDLEVTAFFDAVTKAALIDFQTKHNLEVGTLRMETLKKLGIDISKMTISKY